jgi:hypothetical protein
MGGRSEYIGTKGTEGTLGTKNTTVPISTYSSYSTLSYVGPIFLDFSPSAVTSAPMP